MEIRKFEYLFIFIRANVGFALAKYASYIIFLLLRISGGALSSVRQPARTRGRIIRTSSIRGRGAGGNVIMSSSRPAPYVPEDLVAQAQSVLQGRSRNLIIRELQRTNLDVNLAVNNLLSRDEEDGDDGEEGQADNYVPEDLISLLDAGINSDHPSVIIDADTMFSDDAMFGYTTQARSRSSSSSTAAAAARRSSERERAVAAADAVAAATAGGAAVVAAAAAAAASGGGGSSGGGAGASGSSASGISERERATAAALAAAERDNIFRWRDRQYFGPKRWLESALAASAWHDKEDDGGKKRDAHLPQSPLWLGDELEFWPDRSGSKDPVKFVKIAALHSELVAVSDKGHLYQWRWCDMTPFRGDNPSGNHPRLASLGLTNERVVLISGSNIRCSVVTESGKVATWIDESLAHVCGKLEQSAAAYTDINAGDKIVSLHTCVLYTAIRMESGNVFWWGILPFQQRKRLLEKYTNKKRMLDKGSSGSGGAGSGNTGSSQTAAAGIGSRPSASGSVSSRIGVTSNSRRIRGSAGIALTTSVSAAAAAAAASSSSYTTASKSSESGEIAVGSQVCMRNAPMYQAGSIGFTVAGGVPKVGQLLSAAWNIDDTCRFRIVQPPKRPKLPELPKGEKDKAKEDNDTASMPPPPSPASSTCSDGSISSPAVGGGRRQKRSAPKEEPEKVDEEEWSLKDVIFVEDSRNVPIGRVLKVDGPYAAVRFPVASSSSSSAPPAPSSANSGPPPPPAPPKEPGKDSEDGLLNDNTRLLRKDDLQVVKTGVMPRIPDCFQRAPKKINLQGEGQILALTVDGQGIHAVMRNGAKMSHRVYNISTGKSEVDSRFPTDTASFLGLSPSNIKFQSTGESEFVSLLTDGNRTVYPLVKDSTPSADSIKDPNWLDLLPISALGLGTHPLPHVGSGKKNEVAVMVISFVPQIVLPKILQCDLEGVRRVVAELETDPTSDATIETVQKILEERCDGGRNIFHTAVSMCQPTSNRDADQDSSSGGGGGGSGGGAGSSSLAGQGGMDSMESMAFVSSRAMNLRDMMRRAAAASSR